MALRLDKGNFSMVVAKQRKKRKVAPRRNIGPYLKLAQPTKIRFNFKGHDGMEPCVGYDGESCHRMTRWFRYDHSMSKQNPLCYEHTLMKRQREGEI